MDSAARPLAPLRSPARGQASATASFWLPMKAPANVVVMQGIEQNDHTMPFSGEDAPDFAVIGDPNFAITAAHAGSILGGVRGALRSTLAFQQPGLPAPAFRGAGRRDAQRASARADLRAFRQSDARLFQPVGVVSTGRAALGCRRLPEPSAASVIAS